MVKAVGKEQGKVYFEPLLFTFLADQSHHVVESLIDTIESPYEIFSTDKVTPLY